MFVKLTIQIGKNVNTYFYRAFLKELSNELREKPKRSRSFSKSPPAIVNLPPTQLPNHTPNVTKPGSAEAAKKREAQAAYLESKLDVWSD